MKTFCNAAMRSIRPPARRGPSAGKVVIDNHYRPVERAKPALVTGLTRILERIEPPYERALDIDVGWHPLVVRLDEQLADIEATYRLAQVKQKMGELQYYVLTPLGGHLEAPGVCH